MTGIHLSVRRRRLAATAAAVIAAVAPPLAAQQPLAARIAALGNGTGQFEFPSRDGVCGDGHSYIRINDSMSGSFNSSTSMAPCEPGPVRIVLGVTDGRVTSLRDYAGPMPAPAAGVTELGEVTAAEGSAYLLGLAESRAGERVVERAIFPAMLGRDVVAWPTLLRIAKSDRGRRRGSDVMFWLGQYAAAKLSGTDDPFDPKNSHDEGDEEDVKQHAVFALSQLRNGEGIDPLIQIARTNKDPGVRAKAVFWLGQSGDPRALELFEQVLTARGSAPRG